MNTTTASLHRVRELSQSVAWTRRLAVQQSIDREKAIARHGIAHPATIEASRQLSRTQAAQRKAERMHRQSSSELIRLREQGQHA